MWSPGDRFFLGVGFLPRCFLSLCRFLPPRTSWKKYIVHLSNLFERLSHCEVSGPRLPLVLRAGAPAKNRRLLSTSNRKCPHVLQLLLAVRSKMLYHPYHLPWSALMFPDLGVKLRKIPLHHRVCAFFLAVCCEIAVGKFAATENPVIGLGLTCFRQFFAIITYLYWTERTPNCDVGDGEASGFTWRGHLLVWWRIYLRFCWPRLAWGNKRQTSVVVFSSVSTCFYVLAANLKRKRNKPFGWLLSGAFMEVMCLSSCSTQTWQMTLGMTEVTLLRKASATVLAASLSPFFPKIPIFLTCSDIMTSKAEHEVS